MFKDAYSFNQPIGGWDVSNVMNMELMFYADAGLVFDQDISGWDVPNVENMNIMFTPGNISLSDENKCSVHSAFSSNENWEYDWSSVVRLSLQWSVSAACLPTVPTQLGPMSSR